MWFASDLDGIKYLRKELRLEVAQVAQVAKLKVQQKNRQLLQVRGWGRGVSCWAGGGRRGMGGGRGGGGGGRQVGAGEGSCCR